MTMYSPRLRRIALLSSVLVLFLPSAAVHAPGTFTPLDLKGSFGLDSGDDPSCAGGLEHLSLRGDASGGIAVDFKDVRVEEKACGASGSMLVVPGLPDLDSDISSEVKAAVKKLHSEVKGMMVGTDRGQRSCVDGLLGDGVWVFVRDAEDRTVSLKGKSVKLTAGARNALFVGNQGAMCLFVGGLQRRTRPSGTSSSGTRPSGTRPSSGRIPTRRPRPIDLDSDEEESVCFPADAAVTVSTGVTKPISLLDIGDKVLVTTSNSEPVFSPVFLFTHRDAEAVVAFLKVTTISRQTLYLTPSHYLYINSKLAPASTLRTGDVLSHTTGNVVVSKIERVLKRGLYNPQTLHGDIVVNGFLASTYTTAVSPSLAKGLLAPLKAAYRCGLPGIHGWFDYGAGKMMPVLRLLQSLWPAEIK